VKQLLGLLGGAKGAEALAGRLSFDDGLLPKGRTLRKDVLPHLGDHAAVFLLGGDPATASSGAKAKGAGRNTAAATAADGAIVAEVRDAAALRTAIGTPGKEEQVGDQTIRVTDDHAIWIGDRIAAFGSEPAVRAAIAAAEGADLAGNDRFTGALDQVRTTDPVGVAWIDLQQAPALNAAFSTLAAHRGALRSGSKAGSKPRAEDLAKALPKSLRDQVEKRLGAGAKGRSSSKSGAFGLTIPTTDATAAMALELRPGRLVVRSGGTGATSASDPKTAADAVAELPAGSWAAFGGATSGLLAKGSPGARAFDLLSGMLGTSAPDGLREALAGVEAVSGGAQGQNLLAATGGVVLRAKDDAGADALLTQLEGLLRGRTGKNGLAAKPTKIDGTSKAIVVGLPGLPLEIAAGVQGDRLAIGLGADSVTKALASDERFSSDPLYAQAQKALDGDAPSFVLQPKPLTDLLSSLGGGLGDLLGGGGSGGLGALMNPGGSGSSGSGGIGSFLGSDGFGKVLGAAERVKLITASRQSTGATTWRGSLVVEYDGSAPKTTKKP
jgi:hypothetical protein